MEVLMLCVFIMSVSAFAFFSISPYSLMVMVMIVAMSSSLTLGIMKSSMLGLLLFLVYLGGVQVLFLYALSVVPEEVFAPNYKVSFLYIMLMMSNIFVWTSIYYPFYSMDHHNLAMGYMGEMYHFNLFILMILLLLFVMLVAANLCNKKRIPLRMSGYKSI